MRRRQYLKGVGSVTGGAVALSGCLGQLQGGGGEYPSESITWHIPYSTGGGFDTNTRAIGGAMEDPLGVSVVPTNTTGAGGALAYTEVYNANPDGYTVGSFNVPDVYLKQLYGEVEYDSSEYRWFGAGFFAPSVLLISTRVEYDELADLSDRDEPLRVASTGPRSSSVLAGELILDHFDIPRRWIFGYEGIAEALGAVEVGEADAEVEGAFNSISAGMIREGQLEIGAICSEEPHEELGGPTAAEVGLDNLTGLGLYNLFGAPPETSDDVITTLNDAYLAALDSDRVAEYEQNSPLAPIALSPEECGERMDTSITNISENQDVLDGLAQQA